MTNYNTADAARFLRGAWDRVHKLDLSPQEECRAVERAISERYPGMTIGQYRRVLEIFDEERRHDREEFERKHAAELRRMDDALLIFAGLPRGTQFADACRLKADAVGPDGEAARWWIAYWASPQHLRYSALLDAAIVAHPGWHGPDEHGVCRTDDGAPEESELIDWFQKTHPHQAALIEDQSESKGTAQ